MERLSQFENKNDAPIEISEMMSRFGVGHMSENTSFSIDKINAVTRPEVVETYKTCNEKIKLLLDTLSSLVNKTNVENKGAEVFKDMLEGIAEALHKTANQILYHTTTNPEESLMAFDELIMVLESVNQSILSPEILSKKDYPSSAIYKLTPPKNVEDYKIKTFDTLFSKNHIAFNLTSNPVYQNTDKTIKSGIRLDYGPLYKETPEGIDRAKTEWVTSVDISGYYIDKIMNLYSPRGHHFTKMFDYKVNLLMKSLAEQMEKHFDKSKK
jgi:hypothetical protein